MPPLALPGIASFESQRVLTGEIDDGTDLPPLSVVSGVPGSDAAKDPMSRLRQLIEERQSESVEILRGWMEVEEEVR
jgi:flagellar M-ring protein FliF